MVTKFDAFLACAPKDFIKLPYVVDSLIEFVPQMDNIFICSFKKLPMEIAGKLPPSIKFFMDDEILPELDRSKWAYRPNWHTQQCLKLLQRVTSDWYLTWDCDTIACRKINFIENDKPIYYSGWEQEHKPYFVFQKKLIDIGKIAPMTFIADMNFIYRPYVIEMLDANYYTIDTFIKTCQGLAQDETCYMAEPELYGSYIWKNHREEYIYKKLNQPHIEGRKHDNRFLYVYTDNDVKERIDRYKNGEYDTFSIHSWFIEDRGK
jgi:hypothetical protein